MISVYTPSHNSKFLNDCERSLINQTWQDWEWVVLLNGTAKWESLSQDSRIKVYKSDNPDPVGVGYAKHHACNLCKGDILVELDHDDILLPNALEKVANAFKKYPDIGFVYSEFVQTDENLGPEKDLPFGSEWGWIYIEANINGLTYNVPISPDASFPHNTSLIWYAPNHLRAFRKSLYDEIGGYDINLTILDDQDLMCRMFLKTEFHFIPRILYMQRVHTLNTQKDLAINRQIQTDTVKYYQQYIQPMYLAWAKRNKLIALDLGSAHNKPDGYKGVDLHPGPGVDYCGDIFEVLSSLKDNSVGVIRAVDFLEHIPDKIRLFNELYRVLAHGGGLLTLTPSTDGRGAFQDPTHVAYYNENSFWYFTDKQYAQFVPEIKCKFQVGYMDTIFLSNWHKENNIPYVNANLIAIKNGGPRQFGINLW